MSGVFAFALEIWAACVVITFFEYIIARKRGYAKPMDKPVREVLEMVIFAPIIAAVFILLRLGDFSAGKHEKK